MLHDVAAIWSTIAQSGSGAPLTQSWPWGQLGVCLTCGRSMIESVRKNWKDALTEVLASLLGTLGIVFVIALILSGQTGTGDVWPAFHRYFNEGQIGLSVLSISGVMFLALRKHGKMNSIISISLYALFVVPVLATSFIIGLNPGFEKDILKEINVSRLWWFYFWLHLLWFFILALEPSIPSGEEAGAAEDRRVKSIAEKAAQLGK